MTTSESPAANPWYREPWPWILMSGPFLVIVAAVVSAWIAVSTSDGLVADDYYKQGLSAGETLARSEKAKALGLVVGMRLTSDSIRVNLNARDAAFIPPATLLMNLSHPTRAGIDQKIALKLTRDGYVGEFNLPASGHWLILVEDEAKSWRLMGSVMLPATGETMIGEVAASVPATHQAK